MHGMWCASIKEARSATQHRETPQHRDNPHHFCPPALHGGNAILELLALAVFRLLQGNHETYTCHNHPCEAVAENAQLRAALPASSLAAANTFSVIGLLRYAPMPPPSASYKEEVKRQAHGMCPFRRPAHAEGGVSQQVIRMECNTASCGSPTSKLAQVCTSAATAAVSSSRRAFLSSIDLRLALEPQCMPRNTTSTQQVGQLEGGRAAGRACACACSHSIPSSCFGLP